MRADSTRYHVPGWGSGELWTSDRVVLAHEFDFGRDAAEEPRVRDAWVEELVERLRVFFTGVDRDFSAVPLDLDWATPFQRSVVGVLRAVPRGEVVGYGELAALAGYPRAGRAVGTFCARNRFMVLVPCHRVVASDGVGSYGSAGVGVKRRLLALEGVDL